jgi:hypothetical protein
LNKLYDQASRAVSTPHPAYQTGHLPVPYSPFGRDVGSKEKGTDLDIKSAGARERVAYQSRG